MPNNNDLSTLTIDELRTMALARAQAVLGFTVYMESSLALHKDAVSHALHAFLAIAEPDLNWYSDDKIGRIRRATAKLVRYPLTWLDAGHADQEFRWFMWSGEKDTDAPSYMMEAHSETDANQSHYLSHVHFTFPIEVFSSSFSNFVNFVTDIVSRLPVFYGYGGFLINESLQMGTRQCNMALVYGLAQRFIGLDVGRPFDTAITTRDSIKGVNWLTFINQGFVEKLGGFEALRAKLSAPIVTRRLPSCLLIQAGSAPGVGDLNAGERLPLYREVARALKPIRTTIHPMLGYKAFGSFDREGTDAWLARFDD